MELERSDTIRIPSSSTIKATSSLYLDDWNQRFARLAKFVAHASSWCFAGL
jgi:hypothetical protein